MPDTLCVAAYEAKRRKRSGAEIYIQQTVLRPMSLGFKYYIFILQESFGFVGYPLLTLLSSPLFFSNVIFMHSSIC